MSNPESPYAVSLAEFEQHVSVPRSQRFELVGAAAETTLLSGDGPVGVGGDADGDGDGD